MRIAAAQGKENWKERGMAALFVVALWLILAVFFDFYYDLNDDTAMKDILSGAYTGIPDGHNIQMLYPLGAFVSLFYKAVPFVPWYGIFLCLCQFGALWAILCGLLSFVRKEKRKTAALLLAAAAGVLFLYEFVFVQYTVTAGLLVTAAVVRIYAQPSAQPGRKQWICYHVPTVFLLVLAFYLRTEMMLLLTPFAGFAYLCRICGVVSKNDNDVINNDSLKNDENVTKRIKKEIENAALLFGITGLLMLVGLAADNFAYGSGSWKQFRQLFDDRTEVYDFYGLPDYTENRKFYESAGLSEAEFTLLDNYNFDIDREIDTELMHEIAKYAAAHQKDSMPRRLYLSVYTYLYRFAHGEELVFDLLAACGYFFLVKAALIKKKPLLFLETALLFCMRTALWLFLLYRGRVPERITHPLYLAELLLLLLFFLSWQNVLQWKKYEKSAILSLYVILCLCAALFHIPDVRQQYDRREEINVQWQELKEYCMADAEHFYYVDVYSAVPYSEKLFADTDPAYRNFDYAGGWSVKSPIAAKKRMRGGLNESEAADGGKALLSGKALFVADGTDEKRSPDFLVSYYGEQGKTVRIQEIDRVGIFSIFQINEAE